MRERPLVMHVITRLILGGAQQNTLQSAAGLDAKRFRSAIACGPQTGPEGSLMEAARRRGLAPHIVAPLRRELRPLDDLRALWRLHRLIRRERPAVVHTHSSKAGILGRWAAWLAGVPVVVHTVHGWSFHDRQARAVGAVFRWLERRTARITDVLVAVSRADLERGSAEGIRPRIGYRLIRSAIDTRRVRGAGVGRDARLRAWGLAPASRVVGFLGRLSPQKDPLAFVECAARLCERSPDLHFAMVGDGPLRPSVEARIAERGLTSRFTLRGLAADGAAQLEGFDVLVSSARWEGLPRVLLEAMLLGVPVVATDIPGNREALDEGALGRLVAPGDPVALAEAVREQLAAPPSGGREAARARVEGEFGLDRMLAELDALYTELLGPADAP